MPRSLKQGKAEGLLQGQATHTPGWRDARLHLDRTRPRLGSCEGGWGSGLGQWVAVMPSALDLIARPQLWKAFVIWLPGKVIGLAQIKSYKNSLHVCTFYVNIISNIFSHHSDMKLEIHYMKKTG